MKRDQFTHLNSSPFGRSLHLLTHRLPKGRKAGEDWELERGFRLEIEKENLFEFILASRDKTANPLNLADKAASRGECRFLIWHCPHNYNPEKFEQFADLLSERPDLEAGLILSSVSERISAFVDFLKYREVWQKVEVPVIQIFQAFPGPHFFSVEKTLFDLPRVGFRLQRLAKLRRLFP